MSLVLEHRTQKQVDVNSVNLLLLPSYQTGYWRADKARMSSVSPEESPVFNCSSLLTTSRDQDSECVRLGAVGWRGWRFRTSFNWVEDVDVGVFWIERISGCQVPNLQVLTTFIFILVMYVCVRFCT